MLKEYSDVIFVGGDPFPHTLSFALIIFVCLILYLGPTTKISRFTVIKESILCLVDTQLHVYYDMCQLENIIKLLCFLLHVVPS